MQLTVASRTDIGRVRTNNEDAFLADANLGLYVVCDGMGGHNAGEVASQTACEVLQRELAAAVVLRQAYEQSGREADIKAIRVAVEQALAAACREIFRRAGANTAQAGMGTTCTMVFLAGRSKAIMGHIGDSRLFLLRGGSLHQLSEDHTFVNELVKRGALTKAQAKNHPQGNVLSRAMGPQPNANVDSMIFDTDPGDVYLLCSDGLYNYYPEGAEIAEFLGDADLDRALRQMIDRAMERGGHDNLTGIVLRCGGVAEQASEAAEHRINVLKRIPIFQHLTYNELVRVVGLTFMRRIAAQETLIVEGDRGTELYVVLSGECEVIKGNQSIAILKAGAHVGEMAMIDNAPRSASVRATQDATLLVMQRAEFFALIRSEPVIATKLLWSFVHVMSDRLRDTNAALEGLRANQPDDDDDLEIFLQDDDGGSPEEP